MDVLTKIFNEGKACVLKMNPVNAYLGPFLERAFADAIRPAISPSCTAARRRARYLAGHTARGRGPHHRVRPHVSTDGVGAAGWRAGGEKRERSLGHGQAGHRRARRRLAGPGGAGPVQRQGAGVPGGGRRERVSPATRRSTATRTRSLILPTGWPQRERVPRRTSNGAVRAAARRPTIPGHGTAASATRPGRSGPASAPSARRGSCPGPCVRDLDAERP